MRVGVLYASDYLSLSPGGIREFIGRIGRHAPVGAVVEYVGMGDLHGSLPRPTDTFHSVLPRLGEGPLNGQYVRALTRHKHHLAKFDVVVAHRPEYLLAVPRGTPSVLVLHGGTWNAWRTGRRLFGLMVAASEVVAACRARAVLSVDPRGLSALTAAVSTAVTGIRVPAAAAFRLPNPPPPPAHRLVTACRLAPEKRLDVLIRLAHATQRRLTIFGDGPCAAPLRRLAHELGADVEFMGAVTAAQLAADYHARGGVFCMSSAFEGYPLAAVEAAVAGLPLLGVATKGLRYLEPHGAVVAPTVSDAVEILPQLERMRADAEAVWQLHSPERVAATVWGRVLDGAS